MNGLALLAAVASCVQSVFKSTGSADVSAAGGGTALEAGLAVLIGMDAGFEGLANDWPVAGGSLSRSFCSCPSTSSMPCAVLACAALSSDTSIKIFFDVARRRRPSQSVSTSSTRANACSLASLAPACRAVASASLISSSERSPFDTTNTRRLRMCASKSPTRRPRSLPWLASALSSVNVRVESPVRTASASANNCPCAIRPNIDSTSGSVMVSPQKLMSWSRADSASRMQPSAPRAMANSAPSSIVTFSSPQMYLRCPAMRFTGMRRRS